MPFQSKSQLQTCYQKKYSNWNCDAFLKETPSVCALPYKKGYPSKSRKIKQNEKIKGKLQIGPRGGKFFIITERNSKGIVCSMKVYVKD